MVLAKRWRVGCRAATLAVPLLAGCESRPAADTAAVPVASVAGAAPARTAAPVVPRPDTIDYARAHRAWLGDERRDTLIRLGSRHYWLTMSQVPDSTKPLDFAPATFVTKIYAAPSDTAWFYHRVRGYEGTSTFVLRDSARRTVVFRQQLHKRDFFATDQGEVLTLSSPEIRYAGYSARLGALVFVMYFGLPSSDVIDRTTLLLDARTGRVRGRYRIGSASFEATDCDPQPAPDGQAILTCAGQLLRAGRPPLSLKRPHAELRAARFLTDTTLLAVYEFGDYRPARPDPAGAGPPPAADATVTALLSVPQTEFVASSAQKRQANAFIMSTGGRQLAAFHYDGWEAGPVWYVPRHFVPTTRTYYLLNGQPGQSQSLVLLPKAQPDSAIRLPLSALSKFQLPRQPHEVAFACEADGQRLTFYVDTLRPRRIRYQMRAGE